MAVERGKKVSSLIDSNGEVTGMSNYCATN